MRLGAKAEEGAGLAPPGGLPLHCPAPGALPRFLAEAPLPQCCRAHFSLCPPLSRTLVVLLGPLDDRGHWPVPRPLLTPKEHAPCACPVRSHPRVPVTPGERKKRKRAGACSPVERGWPGVQGQAHTRRPPGTWGLRVPRGREQGPPGLCLVRVGGSRQPGSMAAVRLGPSPPGYREGFLWKRGRDNGQFLSRKFVLTEREGALKYFNRSDVSWAQGQGQRPGLPPGAWGGWALAPGQRRHFLGCPRALPGRCAAPSRGDTPAAVGTPPPPPHPGHSHSLCCG